MDNHVKLLFFVSLFICVTTNAENECSSTSSISISYMYEELGCTPKYDSQNGKCPNEYDCSHIYNRPENTCNLKGTYIADGEEVNREIYKCSYASCKCVGKTFSCDQLSHADRCPEFWLPSRSKTECYLSYEPNRCCSNRKICPPFYNITKCNVNGVTYNEGTSFANPNNKCTECICSPDFNGSFESPICEKLICLKTLMWYSTEIDNYCAPVYDFNLCCPNIWVCPNENVNGTYTPSSSDSELKCKFGDKTMKLGEIYRGTVQRLEMDIECKCVTPPYITCFYTTGIF